MLLRARLALRPLAGRDVWSSISIPIFCSCRATSTAPVKSKGQAQHSSLESFIDHSSIHRLDVDSTVHRGTLYEYTVMNTLKQIAFTLYRSGGPDDKGIDLSGHLTLGSTTIQVVVQCKNTAMKIGPKYIRELCGTQRTSNVILVLASTKQYSEKAIQAFQRSERPIILLVIETYDDGGRMRQFIWNAAADLHLQGTEVRTVFDAQQQERLVVTYEKKRLKPVK